jgi:hypothetical protein
VQIDSFEIREQTTWDPSFPFQVTIRGSALTPRAAPFEGAFGTTPLWALRPTMDGSGLIGYLDDLPPIDAELSVGYLGEPLVRTGLDGTVPG